MASDTYALRQAVWKHEDAVQMFHAGDKPYEHVQAWRDAVVSAAMDMRDAAVARAVAAERARVVVSADEMAALHHLSDYTHYLSDSVSDAFYTLLSRCTVTPNPGGEPHMSRLTAVPVERDADGYWFHPHAPWTEIDEQPLKQFFAPLGYACAHAYLQYEMDEDREPLRQYLEEGKGPVGWEPTPPEGDGWFLLIICDTDDGPLACWLRDTTPEASRE